MLQPVHAALQLGRVVGYGDIGAAGILRVMAGEHLQQQGVVAHRARHRPDMIERVGEGKYATAADAA